MITLTIIFWLVPRERSSMVVLSQSFLATEPLPTQRHSARALSCKDIGLLARVDKITRL